MKKSTDKDILKKVNDAKKQDKSRSSLNEFRKQFYDYQKTKGKNSTRSSHCTRPHIDHFKQAVSK